MEGRQHYQRFSPSETWVMPFNLPAPHPSFTSMHSIEGPLPTAPHSQARSDAMFSTTNVTPNFSAMSTIPTFHSTLSSSIPQIPAHYSSHWPAGAPNLPGSHHNQRVALTEPRNQEIVQEPQIQSRHNFLDWNARYADIKRFYKDENGDLEVTRQKMLDQFGFNASVKQYKDKLAEWNLWKNLSAPKARWIIMKDGKRKREGKDTIFIYGYQECSLERAEKTVKRSKSNRNMPLQEDAPTPSGITYHTPRDVIPSPQNSAPTPVNTTPLQLPLPQPVRWTPAVSASNVRQLNEQTPRPFHLTWNGYTRTQLEAMPEEAYELERSGQLEMAEDRFRTALDGLQNLLAPTHEETNKTAYHLASFYAQHDRMDDADAVLGWMCDKHIERWGINHKKTVDHLLYILELFNRWSRVDDAITLITRAFEAFENSDQPQCATGTRSIQTSNSWTQSMTNLLRRPLNTSATRAFDVTDDPVTMTYQIGLAKTAQDEAEKSVLLGLISQCNLHLDKLAAQLFEAWHALITLYQKLHQPEDVVEALRKAEADFEKVSGLDSKWTGPQLDAAVELAKLFVRAGQFESADSILLKAESEAEILYGEDDDKTIRFLIRIGIFFQDQQRWDHARPRFEHALAASMTWSGLENDRTKRLQAALDNEHFEAELRTSQNIESILRRDWPDQNNRHSTHIRSRNRR